MPSTRYLAILMIAGCSSTAEPPPPDDCATTGHCDLPTDPAEVSCTSRRSDAYNQNKTAFNDGFLRWSCNDVHGVTLDDRGQEYCEYFAIAQLPADGANPAPAPVVLGRNKGENSSYGTTKASVELTAAQISALETDETAVVGQCVFTSWNSDQPGPLPVCGKDGCPKVAGIPLDESTFRMTFKVNSTDAAQLLVKDCLTLPTPGDAYNPRDLRHDDFMRGCLWDADINQTEFRKSDTTICAAMTRTAECGCSVDSTKPLGELISPPHDRGFPLGTWSGFVAGNEATTKLPPSCRYINAGDNKQTLVSCDLSAGDLLTGAADVRAACQDKYADSIVVHVPIPTGITCDPSKSQSPYTKTCSATPWVLKPPAVGN